MNDADIDVEWAVVIDGISGGVLTGVVHMVGGEGGDPPPLDLRFNGEIIAKAMTGAAAPNGAAFSITIPNTVLSAGLGVILVCDCRTGMHYASVPLFVAATPEADLATEVECLKAELSALKAAFLRDASQPKLRAIERDLIVAEAADAARTALGRSTGPS